MQISPRQPKKLMLAGDWHGNLLWAIKAVAFAKSEGVDTILQVGDFGWWPHMDRGEQYLQELNADLDKYRIDLLWVDGNHENHDDLDEFNKPGRYPWSRADLHRITHLPRGFRWEWWDQTWMALGGAHSVDRLARTPGKDWWPGEWLSAEQLEYACRPGPVDVIVAHDCPSGVEIPGILGPTDPNGPRRRPRHPQMFPESELRASEVHRKLIKEVVDDKQPLAYFHGHYHRAYQAYYQLPWGERMFVRGLDKDNETIGRNTFMITEGIPEP